MANDNSVEFSGNVDINVDKSSLKDFDSLIKAITSVNDSLSQSPKLIKEFAAALATIKNSNVFSANNGEKEALSVYKTLLQLANQELSVQKEITKQEKEKINYSKELTKQEKDRNDLEKDRNDLAKVRAKSRATKAKAISDSKVADARVVTSKERKETAEIIAETVRVSKTLSEHGKRYWSTKNQDFRYDTTYRKLDQTDERLGLQKRRVDYMEKYGPNSFSNRAGDAVMSVGNSIAGSSLVGGGLIGSGVSIAGGFLKSTTFGLGVALKTIGTSFVQLSQDVMNAYGSIEKLKVQLGVVFGNDTQANSMFQDIAEYATKSPYGVEQTAEYAVLLKQSGVYGFELLDTMKMIGDVSSGNEEKMKRIANNYAQIEAIGKASMLDMRQFAYAGIPIYKEVANYLGVSQSYLRSMISDGKVTSEIMEEVFKNMTSAGGVFYGAVDKGSQTIAARLQNLKDSKSLMLASLGQWVVNFGNDYGTGGNVSNYIGIAEKITQGLNNWATGRNIEKSVKQIEAANSRISDIDEMIAYVEANKKSIDYADVVLKQLREQRKELTSQTDPQKIIAIQESRYNYAKDALDIAGLPISTTPKQLNALINSKSLEVKALADDITSKEFEVVKIGQMYLLAAKDSLSGLDTGDAPYIDDKTLLGHYQSEGGASGQEYVERKEKRQTGSLGYVTIDNEIKQYEANTAEGKEKERQKKEEKLLAIKDKAARYDTILAEKGNLASLSLNELTDAFNEFGVAIDGDKVKLSAVMADYIDTVTGKAIAKSFPDFQKFQGNIASYVAAYGNGESLGADVDDAVKALQTSSSKITSIEDLSVDSFTEVSRNVTALKELLNKKSSPEAKKMAENIGFLYNNDTLDLTAKNWINIYSKELAKGMQTPDLWKRIIAGSTGLDANLITTGAGAIDVFDAKTRQAMVGNAVGQLFKESLLQGKSMDFASILSYQENTKLDTQQIDFVKTEKNILGLVSRGVASLDVIKTLQSSKQNEFNILTDLAGKMIGTGETLNMESLDEVLVNAFSLLKASGNNDGIILEDENGTKYLTKEVNGVIQAFALINGQATDTSVSLNDLNLATEKTAQALIDKAQRLKTQIDTLNIEASVAEIRDSYSMKKAGIEASNYFDLTRSEGFSEKESDSIGKALEMYKTSIIKNGGSLYDEAGKFNAEIATFVNKVVGENRTGRKDLLNTEIQNNAFTKPVSIVLNPFERYKNYKSSKLDSLYEAKGFRRDEVTNEQGQAYVETLLQDTATNKALLLEIANKWGMENALDENGEIDKQAIRDTSLMENNGITSLDTGLLFSDQKESWKAQIDELQGSLMSLGKSTALDSINTAFSSIGENLAQGNDALDGIGSKMKQIGIAALSNLAPLFIQAGLTQIATGNLPVGLALIAAGGLAALVSGFMSAQGQEDEAENERERLQSIKDQLSDLLSQAREDAIYYENELRHKNALQVNSETSGNVSKVNDAIIKPNGNIISTHPNDWLIATKTPDTLLGGNSKNSPRVSINISNNSGTQLAVSKQQTEDENGNVNLEAIIESVTSSFIASSKSDEAFGIRQARSSGRSVVA